MSTTRVQQSLSRASYRCCCLGVTPSCSGSSNTALMKRYMYHKFSHAFQFPFFMRSPLFHSLQFNRCTRTKGKPRNHAPFNPSIPRERRYRYIGRWDRKTWKEEEEESPPTEEIRNSWLLASKQHEMIR